jgi:hypothetical protein
VGVVAVVVTFTVDPAATAYIVEYFPEISVVMNDPSETYSWDNVSSGWSIVAEEV